MCMVGNKLKDKKYPEKIIKDAQERPLNLNRDKCLQGQLKVQKDPKDFKLSFVTKYSNNARDIKRIFKKNWKILESDPHLKDSLCLNPTIIFRSSKTLKDIIAPLNPNLGKRLRREPVKIVGAYKCNHKKL